MTELKAAAKELLGLFMEDEFLAIGILVIVAVVFFETQVLHIHFVGSRPHPPRRLRDRSAGERVADGEASPLNPEEPLGRSESNRKATK